MIFISYSHSDHRWKLRIEKHLLAISNHSPHKNFYWSDAEISTGDAWREKIEEAKEKTTVAIFLVSADFMASSFIKENEYSYFVNKKDVRIVWFYILPCSWNTMAALSELEAVKFKNKELEPLSALTKNDAEKLIAQTCKELYDFIARSNKPIVNYSTESIYCCNRSNELQYFNDTTAKFIDVDNGRNLLLYSIEGLAPDDLDSLSKSIKYKVLKERYEDIHPKWDIRLPVLNLAPLINNGKLNPDILLIRFKDRLQKELKLSVSNIDHLTVNDIFATVSEGSLEKIIYVITINIPSTSFNHIIYKPFFDWIKKEFIGKRNANPNVIIILLFAFEKTGDVQDLRLENFVKKLTYKSNLPKIFSKRNIQWPNAETEILHLGEHTEVSMGQVEEWNKTYRNGASLQSFASELKNKMRMSEVIKVLQKILSNK